MIKKLCTHRELEGRRIPKVVGYGGLGCAKRARPVEFWGCAWGSRGLARGALSPA